MLILGFALAFILALLALLLGLAEAVIKLNDEDERPTEGISFAKLVITSMFAVAMSLLRSEEHTSELQSH